MSVRYEIDFSEVELLEEKLRQLPGNVEKVLNDVLHKTGVKEVTDHITARIPVSKGKYARIKRHAKMSNWSKSDTGNLEFTVKSRGGAAKNRGSFGYLVFPNEGRGPFNPREQRFMEDGLDNSTSPVLKSINETVDKLLKEAL
ncbi:hypothetical protein [Alkalihalobacillus sp. LMS39]|uniref:hypothetical protein n=1 Tax=Alkalihalobacillus sp. LMS39 TaxID=2924032 RepID=UPI001FB2C532|nr:hypothetical protein [Alkalihalobacillus sp. LMS39]UOE96075.1 hypothetical protein MM271_10945 [Alkalihalobacillus sp. LMS39]